MITNLWYGFIFYNMVNIILEFYNTKKLATNYTSLIHATIASILWVYGDPYIFKINTGGYFIFDICYLLRNREINLLHGLYYYHHCACLYYMCLDPTKYNWFNIITVGELSNMPTYIVYYYLKTDPYHINLKNWKIIQKAWYGLMRLIFLSYMTYNELKEPENRIIVMPIVPVYFMGLLWAFVIFFQ